MWVITGYVPHVMHMHFRNLHVILLETVNISLFWYRTKKIWGAFMLFGHREEYLLQTRRNTILGLWAHDIHALFSTIKQYKVLPIRRQRAKDPEIIDSTRSAAKRPALLFHLSSPPTILYITQHRCTSVSNMLHAPKCVPPIPQFVSSWPRFSLCAGLHNTMRMNCSTSHYVDMFQAFYRLSCHQYPPVYIGPFVC
jgi:hypothetical protein